jgi:ribonuclease J
VTEPTSPSADPVRIIPLGGTGEFGKNMYVVEQSGSMIVVDCGVTFPERDHLGIDLVLPDFSYVRARAAQLEGVVLTHPHEDHIGGLPFLVRDLRPAAPLAVHGSRYTLGLVRSKLDEHKLLGDVELIEVGPEHPVDIGPFRLSFESLRHSVPDCLAVALRTGVGTIVHTGDFRYEATAFSGEEEEHAKRTGRYMSLSRLGRLGDGGVRLLLGDSTGADVPLPKGKERDVHGAFRSLFASSDGRVIVTTFSSHIERVESVLRAAYADGRSVALLGRSLLRNTNIAMNLGYLTPPTDTLISPRELEQLPDDEQVIVCTGSQGEPLAALSRMARGEHQLVEVRPGDTVVYSARTVPGNELAIGDTINRLRGIGARVITPDSGGAAFHVSGHASAWELELMLQLLRPEHFAPVHGELRQQKAHAELAAGLGIDDAHTHMLGNGDVLEVSEHGVAIVDHVPTGMTYVDRASPDDVGEEVLRDRRHLAEDGLVLVVATISADDGALVGDPDIVTRGFSGAEDEDLVDRVLAVVEKSLGESAEARINEPLVLQHRIHDDVSKLLKRRFEQRPLVVPVVVEV